MTERAEERLRDALETLAAGVASEAGAYRRVRTQWRRRERRRRLALLVLVVAIIAVADAVGLWALNATGPQEIPIFNERPAVEAPLVPAPAAPPGQP